jgi:hypothetical protein
VSAPLPSVERPQFIQDEQDASVVPSKKDAVLALRAQGWGYHPIARHLGVNEGQVYRWCNPEAEPRYRARENARRREAYVPVKSSLSPEMRAWISRRKREIAGVPLTAADKEQLARAMDDVGGA